MSCTRQRARPAGLATRGCGSGAAGPGFQPFAAASAAIGQGSAGAVPPPAVPGQMGRTQTGPYEVRSSTMGIMTVSVRAGCETGPVNSTM